MKRPPLFTTEMIVGYMFLFASFYMGAEKRPQSEAILVTIAIVFFVIDLYSKVKYVATLRKEIDKQLKKRDDKDK